MTREESSQKVMFLLDLQILIVLYLKLKRLLLLFNFSFLLVLLDFLIRQDNFRFKLVSAIWSIRILEVLNSRLARSVCFFFIVHFGSLRQTSVNFLFFTAFEATKATSCTLAFKIFIVISNDAWHQNHREHKINQNYQRGIYAKCLDWYKWLQSAS